MVFGLYVNFSRDFLDVYKYNVHVGCCAWVAMGGGLAVCVLVFFNTGRF